MSGRLGFGLTKWVGVKQTGGKTQESRLAALLRIRKSWCSTVPLYRYGTGGTGWNRPSLKTIVLFYKHFENICFYLRKQLACFFYI